MGEGWLQVTMKNQGLFIPFFILVFCKVRKGYLWNGHIGNQTENPEQEAGDEYLQMPRTQLGTLRDQLMVEPPALSCRPCEGRRGISVESVRLYV